MSQNRQKVSSAMRRVSVYSLQWNTSCSFLQPEKFRVCEIRQQRSNFPAAPGCIWPSLCSVCVDLVLNKDLPQVSIWPRKIHQNLEGRNLGPSDQCAKSPNTEEAFCVPSAAQRAHTGPASWRSAHPPSHSGLQDSEWK